MLVGMVTFVAGILLARRGSSAPAICPDCKLLVCPIFTERMQREIMLPESIYSNNQYKSMNSDNIPSCTVEELSNSIIEAINAGARIINLSLGLSSSTIITHPRLQDAYDYARLNNIILVISAGNQGNMGFISLINHPWIIPVAACNPDGVIAAYF